MKDSCTVNCVHVDNIYTNVYILIVDKIHYFYTALDVRNDQNKDLVGYIVLNSVCM